MPKFRKKPVVIEAVRVGDIPSTLELGGAEGWLALPVWLREAANRNIVVATEEGGVYVRTLEGNMLAGPTDWIIQGVNGELYPCKADIFAATYEAVE